MSDLWHESLDTDDIAKVYEVMERCGRHTFQVLTKRPCRRLEWLKCWTGECDVPILPNVWEGTSVENRATLSRIDDLRATPAAVRFLSIEPLLEDLGEIDLEGIHWVIVGGESGLGARPMHPDWARSIRDQCLAAEVPFFFKQWGAWQNGSDHRLSADRDRILLLDGKTYPHHFCANVDGWANPQEHAVCISRVGKKSAGRELDGRTWEEMPCRA